MKEKFIKDMELALTFQRKELLNKCNSQGDIDFDGDETDEVQANLIASINTHLSSLDKEKLSKVDQALSRIKNHMFGACEECGEDISEKRLTINPSFTNCIGCAEQIEFELKRNKRV